MKAEKKSFSVRQTILSFFGLFILMLSLISSGFISYIVYQIEGAIWDERRQDAVNNASNTVVSFLEQREKLLSFSIHETGFETEKDLKKLEILLDSDPAFYELVMVSPEGKILKSVAHGGAVLANSFTIKQSSWFLEAKKNFKYLGSVEFASNGKAYVIMAVSSPNGQVLAARVGMSVLNDIVENISLGESGRIFIVDPSGYILAHPDIELTEGYENVANNPTLFQALSFSADQWHDHYRNLEGVEVLGIAKRIGETGWLVFAEIFLSEAYKNTQRSWIIQLAAILVLSGGMMFVSASYLDRRIFSPIKNLRKAQKISNPGILRLGSRFIVQMKLAIWHFPLIP